MNFSYYMVIINCLFEFKRLEPPGFQRYSVKGGLPEESLHDLKVIESMAKIMKSVTDKNEIMFQIGMKKIPGRSEKQNLSNNKIWIIFFPVK